MNNSKPRPPQTIPIDALYADPALAERSLVDARSPSEFAEDHLPGAENLPVLDDAERALVGTLHRQGGAFEANVRGAALVSGTTGLDPEAHAALSAAAMTVPVLWAANFSLGVALLAALSRMAAAAVPDWDCEIIEMHHRRKQDAPSGTALRLGEAVAAGRGQVLAEVARHGRAGSEAPRIEGEIGFHAVRGGDVIGDHKLVFAGEAECIELSHQALSREVFARGALRAAAWLSGRAPGRYHIEDVLGLPHS